MNTRIMLCITLIGLLPLHFGMDIAQASDQWEEVDLHGGYAVDFAVGAHGMVYASTKNERLYRSSDHGESWTRATQPWEETDWYSAIAVDSSGIVFAGCAGWNGSGLFMSTDQGNSWTVCVDSLSVECLLTTSENDVYVGGYHPATERGVWCSTDQGNTWASVDSGLSGLRVHCLAQNPSGTLFAGVSLGNANVYKSTDSGISWHPTSLDTIGWVHQILCPDSAYVFAVSDVVFRSSNEGSVWERAHDGLPACGTNEIAMTENGTLLAATGMQGVFCSTNNGISWARRDSFHPERQVDALVVNEMDEVLAGTWPEGVLVSSDKGETWECSNHGFKDVDVRCITDSPDGRIWVSGRVGFSHGYYNHYEYHGLYYSSDGGVSWSAGDPTFPPGKHLSAGPDGSLFATYTEFTMDEFEYQLWKSDTTGGNWSKVSNTSGEVASMTVLPDGTILVLGPTLERSLDYGESWEVLLEGVPLTGFCVNPDGHIFVVVHPAGGGSEYLLKSTDGGSNWSAVGDVGAFSIFSSRTGDLYTDGLYIRRSTDSGVTWSEMFYQGYSVRITAFASRANGDICLGWCDSPDGEYYSGAFYLPSDSENPIDFSSGLPEERVNALLVTSSEQLLAGPVEGGLYKATGIVSAVSHEENLPRTHSLCQNYPNPFNPSTMIEFALPKAGYVTLKVYNVLGEEVATLIDGDHAAGTFNTTWDASGLPSGVYFYRLTAGEYVQTKKMVLMK